MRNVTDLMGIEVEEDVWVCILGKRALLVNESGGTLGMENDFHEIWLVAVQSFKPLGTLLERGERGKHGLDADGA